MKMHDHLPSPEAAGWFAALCYKLLPAGLGAAIMIAVDTPRTKGELFARVFVAFSCTYLIGDLVFDLLRTFSFFAFLDSQKRAHTVAVDGLVGAFGWFVLGGIAMWLRRFRSKPLQAIKDAKQALKP